MSSCVDSPTSLKKNNKSEDDDDDENVRIDTPNPNDVLCGRGGNINSHRGNEQFRGFVEKRKRVYLTARFKREKRLIASSIVNEIRAMDPPGRFLARMGSLKDNNVYWHDIGNEKARDKTSQALRENAPSIRAEIETEINQQRAEMRRQETAEKPPQQQQPSTTLSSGGVGSTKDGTRHPGVVPGISASSSMFPPPPLGHHPGHGQPPPPHPPPPPPHPYNPHHSHYAQQYYDYYYHYYGYGAPPPPPPPGYQNSSESTRISTLPNGASSPAPPPSGPQGYPPAPPPYWAAQSRNVSGGNPSPGHSPPATAPTNTSSPPYSSSGHPIDGNAAHTTSNGKSVVTVNKQGIVGKPTATATETVSMNTNVQYPPHSSRPPIHNQEEEDRRMAMALQQQENIKAFEERNRRFGSDRRSSRSTAYCSPGYRPRLLNDNTPALLDGDRADGSVQNLGTHVRKKRPAMSDSHFFSNNTSCNNLVSLDHRNNNNNNNYCDSGKGEDTMKHNLQSVNVSSTENDAAAAVLPPRPMSQQDIMDHRMAVALQEQEDNALSHRFTANGNVSRKPSRSNARTQVQRVGIGNVFGGVESIVPASLMTWTRGGGDTIAENDGPTTASVSAMEPNNRNNNNNNSGNNGEVIMGINMSASHHRDSNGYDMDRKPAAASQGGNDKQELDGLDHHHDFSCSSFSSRSRVQFKDDSDMISLFGEGDTIIPPPTTNSTGSFNRVRNTFATNNSGTINKTNNNNDNNHFSPIALNEKNQNHHSQHHHQRSDSNRDRNNDHNNNRIHQHKQQQQQQQDSSLLSQVATHILGNLGGGSSWTDSNTGPSKQMATTLHQASFSNNHLHQQERNNHHHSPEMEMESGQEVIMDVRDESSMPPPQPRGSGVQIDWPSRAGCHTWIPDTIGANSPAIFGQNNGDEHEHQDMSHANDHSLTRQNIYGRSDISPINSMDMDFSHSSYVGDQRRRNNGGASSSLLHVFDQKNDDSNPEETLPQIHRSVLQQVPSWDRSFRSRSPISLGDLSVGGNEMDDSLIRVHSHDVIKEKMFGVEQPPSSSGHDLQQRCQQPLQHHSQIDQAQTKPPPTYHHSHRHHHQQTPSPSQPQNYHESRDMDWEEHAGE